MAFERFFEQPFEKSVQNARAATGIMGALIEGCTHSEDVLFYVGAIFVAHGTYSQIVEALNLIVFIVPLSSQLTGFSTWIPRLELASLINNSLANTFPLLSSDSRLPPSH